MAILRVICVAVGFVYLHFFLEWLFFFTKNSFLTRLDLLDKIEIFAIAPLPIVGVVLVLLLITLAIDLVIGRFLSLRARRRMRRIVPSCIMLASLTVLVDSWFYNVFRTGIPYLSQSGRVIATAVFVFVLFLSLDLNRIFERYWKYFGFTVLVLILGGGLSYWFRPPMPVPDLNIDTARKNFPNILIISTDGLEADRLGLYGYQRNTTPFIDSLEKNALLFENTVPNSSKTTSSVSSLLTGRMPTKTGVVYYPDIFSGSDSYLHFPGVLKKLGYYTADISVRLAIDAYDMNYRESFDEAFYRTEEDIEPPLSSMLKAPQYQNERYFLLLVSERMTERVLDLLWLKRMRNYFDDLTGAQTIQPFEMKKQERLFSLLSEKEEPLFAFIHLMGTHGPLFYPRERLFSKGKKQEEFYDNDFYDDAVRSYDEWVKELMGFLKEKKILQNTIVIITSDHGIKHQFSRVPLLFLFPEQEHTGRIKENAQLVDVVPTLLHYLEVNWKTELDGDSLIPVSELKQRAIGIVTGIKEHGMEPPNYNLERVSVMYCNKLHEWNLNTDEVLVLDVVGHTGDCESFEHPKPEEVANIIREKFFLVP